jgi:uncharacterized surface protein with fasciclin (FAS1) repeats
MLRLSTFAIAAIAATSGMAIAQTTPAPASNQTMPQATTGVQAGVQADAAATATANPTVGGAEMLATRNIVENAAAAPNLTTLVQAVQAADLADTLAGPGPFTVFAPENDAFTRLAPGTLDTLLKPENKATLAKVLTYHVVPGNVTLEQLRSQIEAGGGTTTLTTVEGSPLTVAAEGAAIVLTDVSGNKSYVAVPDVKQSNGVVHVVNGVVVPKLG